MFMGMVGVKSFDSITAPARPNGSVRVLEYSLQNLTGIATVPSLRQVDEEAQVLNSDLPQERSARTVICYLSF